MIDVDKIIKGMEHCTKPLKKCDKRCPYYEKEFCHDILFKEALIAIKEQNKIIEHYHEADAFLQAHG